ncbi:hypothetical protein [Nocardioides sp. GY 10127]|uniref:hypothetical protein n=1 Tax=Nocardioides sp. GY 10127 TaxID=2569762 RepID=UPI0010A7EBFA|nr:hypothetical protein [Nocardioides sp. GY 10127]TIC84398.1 hypothetical protein E8D37_06435 [Nocardioides sp. GY 10127]
MLRRPTAARTALARTALPLTAPSRTPRHRAPATRTSPRRRGGLVAALAVLASLVTFPLGLATAADGTTEEVPGDTIVRVTGDAENGFGVKYFDGSSVFPPTLSEALAECSEYHRATRRVRCRTEVVTWYRDLGDLQRAIAYARADEAGRLV